MDRLRGGSVIVVSPSCGGGTIDSDRETGRVVSGEFNGMFFNGGESGQRGFLGRLNSSGTTLSLVQENDCLSRDSSQQLAVSSQQSTEEER